LEKFLCSLETNQIEVFEREEKEEKRRIKPLKLKLNARFNKNNKEEKARC
jgi:chaperonin cofactor prefoldin